MTIIKTKSLINRFVKPTEASVVEFISYNGDYPNLCSGTLVIEINHCRQIALTHCLRSNGAVWFDDEYNEHVDCGDWEVNLRDYPSLEPIADKIKALVNEHVPQGCCGGCI